MRLFSEVEYQQNALQKICIDAAASDIEIYGNVLGFGKEGIEALRNEYLHLGTETTKQREQEEKDNQKKLQAQAKASLERKFEGTSPGAYNLTNLGSTCYIDVGLQMLYSITQFRAAILEIDLDAIDKVTHEKGFKDTVTYRGVKSNFIGATQNLFREMSGSGASEATIEAFLASLRPFGFEHKGYADCEIFICAFFTALRTALIGTAYASVVDDIYDAVQISTRRCENNHQTNSFQKYPITYLSTTSSLKSSLEVLTAQKYEGKNSRCCKECGQTTETSQTKFLSTPPVLMFKLEKKRYNEVTDTTEKVLDECSFPDKIAMSPYLVDKKVPGQIYELIGVITHIGTTEGIHYWTHVKNTATKKWSVYDDLGWCTEIPSGEPSTPLKGRASGPRSSAKPPSTPLHIAKRPENIASLRSPPIYCNNLPSQPLLTF
ncbi:hypothetical protein AGMMS49949_01900 [Alphaproteobacteria bacterium]|nr:hypothetical protein AGMMS49949_01900 [Alphaproteobacteria bacterium]GHS95789.1 hypothetical protein AGMMS50296_0930 [Alphaproteobacteria bacterium]